MRSILFIIYIIYILRFKIQQIFSKRNSLSSYYILKSKIILTLKYKLSSAKIYLYLYKKII